MADIDMDKFSRYLLDLAGEITRHTADYKDQIMPLGTREQWQAWECLRDAAANLGSAGVYVELHAQKMDVLKAENAKRVQRAKNRE